MSATGLVLASSTSRAVKCRLQTKQCAGHSVSVCGINEWRGFKF